MWQVTTAFLKPDSGKYLGVSQKTLNATGCRCMLFWASSIARQFAEKFGTDLDMHLNVHKYRAANLALLVFLCAFSLASSAAAAAAAFSRRLFLPLFLKTGAFCFWGAWSLGTVLNGFVVGLSWSIMIYPNNHKNIIYIYINIPHIIEQSIFCIVCGSIIPQRHECRNVVVFMGRAFVLTSRMIKLSFPWKSAIYIYIYPKCTLQFGLPLL